MILEDDFIFDPERITQDVSDDINNFLLSQNPTLYSLGCFNFGQNPFNKTHVRLLAFGANHAVIYSKEARQKLKTAHQDCSQFRDIDFMTSKLNDTYCYCKPICVQTFPVTENRTQWGGDGNKAFISKHLTDIFRKFTNYMICYLEFEKEEGIFAKWELVNRCLYIIQLMIVLSLVMFIGRNIGTGWFELV